MSTSTLQETTPSNAAGDLGRRAFLARAGNTALAVPITTSLIVSASATPAIAGSPYGGEGGGHGPKHKPHHKGKKEKHGGERKSAVKGKSVSVRVDLSWSRIIKKKKKTQNTTNHKTKKGQ